MLGVVSESGTVIAFYERSFLGLAYSRRQGYEAGLCRGIVVRIHPLKTFEWWNLILL